MNAEEKAEVCAECGRGGGWHDGWCSEFWRDPLQPQVIVPQGAVGVTVIRKLEDVE